MRKPFGETPYPLSDEKISNVCENHHAILSSTIKNDRAQKQLLR